MAGTFAVLEIATEVFHRQYGSPHQPMACGESGGASTRPAAGIHGDRVALPLSQLSGGTKSLCAQQIARQAPMAARPEARRTRAVWRRARATRAAVEHLGYVQIDTINVIERCHHQILYTRIPGYRRDHLRQAQTVDKTVFEYWTHALSYVPDSGPAVLPRRHEVVPAARSPWSPR